jgi:hypothetical protein
MKQVITYLDPRSAPSAAIDPYVAVLAPLEPGRHRRIGLLANGFPDSVNFLERLVEELSKRTPPGTAFTIHNKGNAAAVASDSQIAALAKESDAVVTAYGH